MGELKAIEGDRFVSSVADDDNENDHMNGSQKNKKWVN